MTQTSCCGPHIHPASPPNTCLSGSGLIQHQTQTAHHAMAPGACLALTNLHEAGQGWGCSASSTPPYPTLLIISIQTSASDTPALGLSLQCPRQVPRVERVRKDYLFIFNYRNFYLLTASILGKILGTFPAHLFIYSISVCVRAASFVGELSQFTSVSRVSGCVRWQQAVGLSQ